jgi:hypothetical protein
VHLSCYLREQLAHACVVPDSGEPNRHQIAGVKAERRPTKAGKASHHQNCRDHQNGHDERFSSDQYMAVTNTSENRNATAIVQASDEINL